MSTKIPSASEQPHAETAYDRSSIGQRCAESIAKTLTYGAIRKLDQTLSEWRCEVASIINQEVGALQADTERLDWLSTKMFITESHNARGISVGVDEFVSPRGTLREAIDAARQK